VLAPTSKDICAYAADANIKNMPAITTRLIFFKCFLSECIFKESSITHGALFYARSKPSASGTTPIPGHVDAVHEAGPICLNPTLRDSTRCFLKLSDRWTAYANMRRCLFLHPSANRNFC